VPLSALYAALAFGYTIAFGVTRRADITYGALFAFAGQMLLLFTDVGYTRMILILPAALLFGVVIAFAYTIGAGLFIGGAPLPPLSRQEPNMVIVAALGMVIVLGETARLASDTRSIWLPPLMNSVIVFWDDGSFKVTLTAIQLMNVGLMCAMVLIGSLVLA